MRLPETLAALRFQIRSGAWATITNIICLLLLLFPVLSYIVAPNRPAAYPSKFNVIHAVVYIFLGVCMLIGHRIGANRSVECQTPGTPSKNLHQKMQQRVEAGQVLRVASRAMLIGFAVVSHAFAHAPYSPMWRTNCSEFDTADALRLADAESFLSEDIPFTARPVSRSLRGVSGDFNTGTTSAPHPGKVCIAFATAPRQGHYLTQAVASLLQGNLLAEASEILAGPILLVTSHEHEEAETLARRHHSTVELRHVRHPNETTIESMAVTSKVLRETQDYIAALEACAATSASYALVLEDDVISGPGILQGVVAALQRLETRRAGNWLSLRLWAHDKFVGLAFDDHLLSELLLCALFGGLACALFLWPALGLRSWLSVLLAWSVSAIGIAILFEAAGRQYVVPSFSTGLSLDYSLATDLTGRQKGYAGVATTVAQVFPTDARLTGLLQFLRSHVGEIQIDALTRRYVIEESQMSEQWMLWPPLVQHIGRISSVGHTGTDWKCRSFPLATSFRGHQGTVLA